MKREPLYVLALSASFSLVLGACASAAPEAPPPPISAPGPMPEAEVPAVSEPRFEAPLGVDLDTVRRQVQQER